jgi:hypothetical protein
MPPCMGKCRVERDGNVVDTHGCTEFLEFIPVEVVEVVEARV